MQTINEDIKSGNFKKVYLLFGDEEYLKKQYASTADLIIVHLVRTLKCRLVDSLMQHTKQQ